MWKTSEKIEQAEIPIDMIAEKAALIEQIHHMNTNRLLCLQIYAKYLCEITKEPKLALSIGVSDYCEASTSYYYVDKTMMIKDFLDECSKVSLFLRPRRFGKTLNMDMLRVFFEKTEEDTSIYFRNKSFC